MTVPTDSNREAAQFYNRLLLDGGEDQEDILLRAITLARAVGRREERERCAKIVKEIKDEADRDAKSLGPDGDAAVCWADCAATILQEITRP